MKKNTVLVRIVSLGAMFLLICAAYLVLLINYQITGHDYYLPIGDNDSVRYVKIDAKRGEIYDRNGKALVINTTNYSIELEYGAMPRRSADFNAVILSVRNALASPRLLSADRKTETVAFVLSAFKMASSMRAPYMPSVVTSL